ncbi:transketolase C-terminal domain-containing protein [Dehalobacterium formicoaceticum]|uniref:Pyruvate ferredoxin oxidoreductase n=1 Tax=Dehalobacterium formicoaceticum TaxID=51515 RepID=A0ABT1Y2J2_9FIRM|nr:transketolase C-terminal domain-containing protein [Dehalobacterium formicoaceticum]MCR6545087.1 pyruvate ferredoxin oxidoreductase [Dehalobacterium formicoaceticum]
MKKILDTGNAACALAVKAAHVDMIAAYPITPQTSIAEKLASYIGSGEMNAKYLPVESEHSALSAISAASTVGARVFTATSSQGLLYMHEIIHYAAGGRLPLVMANVNRAVCAPWCLYVDHQDSISQRDTGWIQFYAASNQEIYDTVFLAYKVAEASNVPVMVNFDGFLLSHSMMPFQLVEQEVIDKFLPPYEPAWQLHPKWGGTFANVTPSHEYVPIRTRQAEDIMKTGDLIKKFSREYQELTGHWHGDLFDVYRQDGAEVFLLSMGSMAAEMEIAVDMLREEGIPAAGLRLRVFRPFPGAELSQILPQGAKLLVFDRNCAFGTGGGALLSEAKNALFDRRDNLKVAGQIMGLGGEDLPAAYLAQKAREMMEVIK